jgi:HEPN domain-containing protein
MADVEDDIQQWLRFAESDMTAAEVLYRAGQDLNAIFHVQQSVEKTLKALFVKQTKEEPPRIHSLRKLVARCGLNPSPEQVLLLEKLGEYYVESRYPGSRESPSPAGVSEEAERLMAAAKEFIHWVRSQI